MGLRRFPTLLLVLAFVFALGCIGKEPGVGDTANLGSLKVTLKDVSIKDEEWFGKHLVVRIGVKNTGGTTAFIGMGMLDGYIQDDQGKVYRSTRRAVPEGGWKDTLEPGESRDILIYFSPNTPAKNVKLFIKYGNARIAFKL